MKTYAVQSGNCGRFTTKILKSFSKKKKKLSPYLKEVVAEDTIMGGTSGGMA